MDAALHVTRGHGQSCVYSAARVGTVCVRCVVDVITHKQPPPHQSQPQPLSCNFPLASLATTRARFARRSRGLSSTLGPKL
jgi:hypothetical protein